MERFAKLVVFFVMVAVSASSLGAQAFLLPAQLQQPPAGCHEHGSKAPAPHSTSYQCCLTGHNTAVPQTSHSPEPILHDMQIELLVEAPVGSLATGGLRQLTVSSGDPPGVTPLRI
jgi:hypothetical protein